MLTIIRNVIITNIRSSKFVLFNMFFPIFIMVLIGSMMNNSFINTRTVDDINISYYNEGNEQTNLILDTIKENDFDMDISIEEVDSVDRGKQLARMNKSVFLHLNEEDIDVYANDQSQIDSYGVNSILKSINDQIHFSNIVKENIDLDTSIDSSENPNTEKENIVIEKLPVEQSMRSFDYYGVVHMTMMTMYASLYPIYSMRSEREYKLKDRIHMAGVSNKKYYIGSFIGYVGLGSICITPGYLFSMLVLKTNLGENPLLPYLLMVSLIMLFVGMSMFIEAIFKDTDKVQAVLQGAVFQILSFLGGCYIALPDDAGGILQIASNISPLRWVNRAIFRLNFDSDMSMYMMCMAVNIIVCIVFILGTIKIAKREERIS